VEVIPPFLSFGSAHGNFMCERLERWEHGTRLAGRRKIIDRVLFNGELVLEAYAFCHSKLPASSVTDHKTSSSKGVRPFEPNSHISEISKNWYLRT
jgi:hypothetical protein